MIRVPNIRPSVFDQQPGQANVPAECCTKQRSPTHLVLRVHRCPSSQQLPNDGYMPRRRRDHPDTTSHHIRSDQIRSFSRQ
jgi:hypothetical protein